MQSFAFAWNYRLRIPTSLLGTPTRSTTGFCICLGVRSTIRRRGSSTSSTRGRYLSGKSYHCWNMKNVMHCRRKKSEYLNKIHQALKSSFSSVSTPTLIVLHLFSIEHLNLRYLIHFDDLFSKSPRILLSAGKVIMEFGYATIRMVRSLGNRIFLFWNLLDPKRESFG